MEPGKEVWSLLMFRLFKAETRNAMINGFRLRIYSVLEVNKQTEWADIPKAPGGQLREPFNRERRMFCFSSQSFEFFS